MRLAQVLIEVLAQPERCTELLRGLGDNSGWSQLYGGWPEVGSALLLAAGGAALGVGLGRRLGRLRRWAPWLGAALGLLLQAHALAPPGEPRAWAPLLPASLLLTLIAAAAAALDASRDNEPLVWPVALLAAAAAALGSWTLAVVGRRVPEAPWLLARALLVLATAATLGGLLRPLSRRQADPAAALALRVLTWALPALVTLAETLGDRALADQLLRGTLGTLAVLPCWRAARRVLGQAHEALAAARWRWVGWLRRRLGLADEPLPGLDWLLTGAEVALGAAACYALGAAWSSPATARGWWLVGWRLGSGQLVPWHAVQALLAFSWLLALSRLATAALAAALGRRDQLDPGARDAAVALAGYGGWILAALAALDLALGSLTQLTVVAGALSVGIGFGLQAIVSNFVSGLILLFERPIRAGDWVRVGATEGRVSRITVRHTELRTAAGAEVIVPNSDLLTQQVLNETRHDTRGRLELCVKVDPAAAPAEVRGILLALAAAHPLVLGDAEPAPTVLLRSLTDTGYEYVLWCTIAQVEQRARVVSDLAFGFDEALRARGIRCGH